MSKSQSEIVTLSSIKRDEVLGYLDEGHHPDHLYYNNETLLTYLSRNCSNAELPLYLLAKGANPYIANSNGETAFDFAMQNQHGFLIRMFSLEPINRELQTQRFVSNPQAFNADLIRH